MNIENIERKCSNCGTTFSADVGACPNCGSYPDDAIVSTAEKSASDKDDPIKLTGLVLEEIKKGADDFSISQKLVEMGMNQTEASQLVQQVRDQAMKIAEEERITVSSSIPAIAGALGASLIGGILWGLIVITTNHEIGYMALGIGWLAGYAVVKLSGEKKGVPFQIIAVASSLVGILIGKYLTFEHFLEAEILKSYGADAAAAISIFSGKVILFFFSNIGSMLNGYDALWVILAIVTAWKIPKGIGIKKQGQVSI